MIFVDTSGWFASIVPSDRDHEIAKNWFLQNGERLFTTDYVVDETLTLFKSRDERTRALQIAEDLFSGELAEIFYLSEGDILQIWNIFQKFSDKDLSFNDCSSKFIFEMLGVPHTFSFDKHFRQFGTVLVLP